MRTLFQSRCPTNGVQGSAARAASAWLGVLLACAAVDGRAQEMSPTPVERKAVSAAAGGVAVVDSNYRMRPGDTVRVTVFGEPELAVEGRLDALGRLQCALVGSMGLAQQTVTEASQHIEEAYRQDYLVRPEVTVSVLQFTRRTVTVLGQVMRPGAYDLPEGGELNLLELLGMAGGSTRIARLSKVKISRKGAGQGESQTVDVTRLLNGKENAPFILREGDVITVPESWF